MSTRNGTKSGRVTPKNVAPVEINAPPIPVAPEGKLRVLKVLVQPVFVLVQPDGNLQEVQHPAVEIKSVDWAEWSATVFTPASLEVMRQNLTTVTPT